MEWTALSKRVVMSVILVSGLPTLSAAVELPFDAGKNFDDVWLAVSNGFLDPELNGVDWEAKRGEFRPRAVAAKTHQEFAQVMNAMLATLRTSHTKYFASFQPEYYQLTGIFEGLQDGSRDDAAVYEGIGIATVERQDGVFVQSVFDGTPAAIAGLKHGDRLVSVNGQPYAGVDSFRGQADKTCTVRIQRDRGGQQEEIAVKPVRLDGRNMFVSALEESAKVIRRDDFKIGYLHVWSYAGRKYHDKVEELLLHGEMQQCDGLVFDLRDGWGGADWRYLDLFAAEDIVVEFRPSGKEWASNAARWTKPVVMLVNERTRSGKELLAYAFKKRQRGVIVGTKTAGAVVAGKPIPLRNGDLLYLAVSDVRVDGVRLEGTGVTPDIQVERPFEYSAGADPQLEAALEAAVESLNRS